MSHQFHILCDSEESAKANHDKLNSVIWEDDSLFSLRLEGKDVFGGCRIYQPIPSDSVIEINGKNASFMDIFYLADNLKSGMHHPHGVFWVYQQDRKFDEHSEVIPLENATRIILDECGVA